MKTVIITIKKIEDPYYIYPANEAAELFASLSGTRTFQISHIETIKQLGFEVLEKKADNTYVPFENL